MTVKERLLEYIKFKGLSTSRFQQSVGMSTSYVQNISRSIGTVYIRKIEETYPDLNMQWLLEGTGDMIVSVPAVKNEGIKYIKVVPVSAMAGTLNEFTESIKEGDCENLLSPISDADLAINISGDSMSPNIPNGSRVIVKKINEKAFIEWGKTFVLDTCNGIVVKDIFPSETEGKLRCVSKNKLFPDFEVNTSDIYGMYKVVMVLYLG